jgi:hypothetical protein
VGIKLRFSKEELTRKALEKCKKLLNKFLKNWVELCPHIYIKGWVSEDYSNEGTKEVPLIYVHYHLALRSLNKQYRDLALIHKTTNHLCQRHKLGVEFKLADNSGGFRKANSLINYHSKRASGLFGHKDKGTDFVYSDIWTEEEYYKLFHRRQRIFLIAGGISQTTGKPVEWSSDEKKYIRENQQKLIRRKLVILPSGKLGISLAEEDYSICPHCGCSEFVLIPYLPNEPPSCIKGEQPSITHEEISLAC